MTLNKWPEVDFYLYIARLEISAFSEMQICTMHTH